MAIYVGALSEIWTKACCRQHNRILNPSANFESTELCVWSSKWFHRRIEASLLGAPLLRQKQYNVNIFVVQKIRTKNIKSYKVSIAFESQETHTLVIIDYLKQDWVIFNLFFQDEHDEISIHLNSLSFNEIQENVCYKKVSSLGYTACGKLWKLIQIMPFCIIQGILLVLVKLLYFWQLLN